MENDFKITLKAARVNKGLTQKQMAIKMGKSEGTIINWENGRTNMRAKDFEKWCSILNLNKNDVFLPKKSS